MAPDPDRGKRVLHHRRAHVYVHRRRGVDHAPVPVEVRVPLVELVGDAPGEHEHDGGPLTELERRYAWGDR